MLLLHGYPLSGALFVRVRDELARRFQVITLDHRGYGMSTAPGVPDSIAIYAQDALDVMSEIGVQQAIIGGMSMGGPIVFEMYQRAPERFPRNDADRHHRRPRFAGRGGLWRGIEEMIRQEGVDSLPGIFDQGHAERRHPREPARAGGIPDGGDQSGVEGRGDRGVPRRSRPGRTSGHCSRRSRCRRWSTSVSRIRSTPWRSRWRWRRRSPTQPWSRFPARRMQPSLKRRNVRATRSGAGRRESSSRPLTSLSSTPNEQPPEKHRRPEALG